MSEKNSGLFGSKRAGGRRGHKDQKYERLYRSYVSAQKQVEKLSTLREITLSINSTLDLNETLRLVVDTVCDALDVRRVMVYIHEAARGILQPVVARFGNDLITEDRLKEDNLKSTEGIYGEAIRHRRVVVSQSKFESVAAVPLIAKDEMVGLMTVEDKLSGEEFTEDDTNYLRTLSSHIAAAINNARLYALAVTDGLTGLYVRRYFDLRMSEEFSQAERYSRPFALIMIDIDHFKRLNDTYGHQCGDRVLVEMADLIRNNVRGSDIACRYGGEELAIILPETSARQGYSLATKLRRVVEENRFAVDKGGEGLAVTISIGVAGYSKPLESSSEMVAGADAALYRAKEAGRNTVRVAE